jgi:Uma2 family endonuclease
MNAGIHPIPQSFPTIESLTNLPETDGKNMESAWQREQITLLIHSLNDRWAERHDFYCGGNMFIYYSPIMARNIDFRGPDFFAVLDVNREPLRKYWAVWDEGDRYPDTIIELISPTTADEDRNAKMKIYERTFHTQEYYLFDPETERLEGYRLNKRRYRPIELENGRLWCETLECWLGPWVGEYAGAAATWMRMFERDGRMILTGTELAVAETQRANAETQRANAEAMARRTAEAEIARLKAELERVKSS